MTSRIVKIMFFGLIVKPVVFLMLGLNIRNREKLPHIGPAIITPNHNSHLDVLVLMSLYPLSIIHRVRPIAAADYFLSNRILAWVTLNVIGIIPIKRKNIDDIDKLFDGCKSSLANKDILIFSLKDLGELQRYYQSPKKESTIY